MDVSFKSEKLAELCNDGKALKKKHGDKKAKRIKNRLAFLESADNLEMVPHTPPTRRHQLQGDRAGEYAVDIEGPWRMTFRPNHDPIPLNEDGGIDIKKITAIEILEICEDYH